MVGEFLEHRLHRALPGAVIAGQQIVGRRNGRWRPLFQRREEARFIPALAVELAAADETRARKRKKVAGDVLHGAAADGGLQPKPRHLITQGLALLGRPVLGELTGGIKACVS